MFASKIKNRYTTGDINIINRLVFIFMNKLRLIMQGIKKIPSDILFFYFFLLIFPLSIRKIILQIPVGGYFNEYSAMYIYGSDVIFCGLIFFWMVTILRNKSSKLSISDFHGKPVDKLDIKSLSTGCFALSKGIFIFPLVFLVLAFLSIFWSENPLISIYRTVRFLELYVLYVYVALRFIPYYLMFHVEHLTGALRKTQRYFRAIVGGFIFIMLFDHYLWDIWQGQVLFSLAIGVLAGINFEKYKKEKNCSTWNILGDETQSIVPRGTIDASAVFYGCIVFVGVFQSVVGIVQVIFQHSVGMFFLKESIISPNIAGVAKIIAVNQPYIRAYGLFPHPNILGGFLFFSVMITYFYLNCSTWNNLGDKKQSNVPRGTIITILIKAMLAIQLVGLFFSASKSAIFALIIAFIYINVPRGTFIFIGLKRLFYKKWTNLVFCLGIFMVIVEIFKIDVYRLFLNSIKGRELYLLMAGKLIKNNPILGVGNGQFVIVAEKIFPNLEQWQYQPVHSVFLLIWAELGIVGLILFVLFLWKLLFVEE